MSHTFFVAAAWAVSLVVSAPKASSAPQTPADATRPNIIVIQTDDQDLGSIDARLPDGTPVCRRIREQLAERGARFTRAFATTPLCGPSRASLLTGQYAHNHTVLDNVPPHGGWARLDESETLPVWLQRAGYFTMHVGKYINGYGEACGVPQACVPPGWNRWFTLMNPDMFYGNMFNSDGFFESTGNGPSAYQTDVLTRRALAWLRTRPYGSRPFYLQLDFVAPHSDGATGTSFFATPAPRHQGAMNGEPLPTAASFNELDVSDKPMAVRALPLLSFAAIQELAVRYRKRCESLLAVDEAVGRLLDTLEVTGQLANTMIVFTSDNGFQLGQHRIFATKNFPYEAPRVPLFIRGPGVPVATISQLTAHIDLAPTILEWAGAAAARPLDGRSLGPLMQGASIEWREELLLEHPSKQFYRGLRTRSADGASEFLYLEYDYDEDGHFDERELYSLKSNACSPLADPELLESLHTSPCASPLLDELHARLATLRACVGGGCP